MIVSRINELFSTVINSPDIEWKFGSESQSSNFGNKKADTIDVFFALKVNPLAIELIANLLSMKETVNRACWFKSCWSFGLLFNIIRIHHSVILFAEVGSFKNQLFNIVFESQQIIILIPVLSNIFCDFFKSFNICSES